MIESLNFPKWFSRLCWNFNKHFGQTVAVVPEPVLAMDALYDETAEQAAPGSEPENTHGESSQAPRSFAMRLPRTIRYAFGGVWL